MFNTSFPFDSTPISASASTMPLNSAPALPVTSSHVPDFVRNPFDEFPSASLSTTFVTKSEAKELTFPEFTDSLGYEAWYNMALRRMIGGGAVSDEEDEL